MKKEKSMEKNKNWLKILSIVSLFGIIAIGCDNDPINGNENGNGNGNGNNDINLKIYGTWVNEFEGFCNIYNNGTWEGGSNGNVDVIGAYDISEDSKIICEQILIRGDFFELDHNVFYSKDEVKTILQMTDDMFNQKYSLLFVVFEILHLENEDKINVNYNNFFTRSASCTGGNNKPNASLNGKWGADNSVELEMNNGNYQLGVNIIGTYTSNDNSITFKVKQYRVENVWYTKKQLVDKYTESGKLTENLSDFIDALFNPQMCNYNVNNNTLIIKNMKFIFYFPENDIFQEFIETKTYIKK